MPSDSSEHSQASVRSDSQAGKPAEQVHPGSYSWGPFAAIVGGIGLLIAAQFAAYVLGVIVAGVLGVSQDAATDWLVDVITGQFVFTVIAEVLMVFGVIVFVRARRAALSEAGLDRPRSSYLLYGAVGFVLYIVVYLAAIAAAQYLFPGLNVDQEQDIGFDDPIGRSELILTFISLAILPPIAEEVLFRGFMFHGLRKRFRLLSAAVITSVIFAAGHLQIGNGAPLLWVAAIDTFVLSMILCYIRERTGSVWTGVVIHGLKNSLAFSVLYILPQYMPA